MPGIGASEIILILLIAFIVVGPKDLPKISRALARAIKRILLLTQEIKKETGLDEVESEINSVRREIHKTIKAVDVRSDLKETEKEIDQTIRETRKEIDHELKETREEIAHIGSDVENGIREAKVDIKRDAEE